MQKDDSMFDFLKLRKQKKVIIKSPLDGEIINLKDVPDKVFAQKMVGDGIAILPNSNCVNSPAAGEVIQVFPTNHAMGIITHEGLEILIHLGIETVKLKGKGFTPLVTKGQKIKPGDPLMKVDWDFVSKNAESTISPILITNVEKIKTIETLQEGKIKSGQDMLLITLTNG